MKTPPYSRFRAAACATAKPLPTMVNNFEPSGPGTLMLPLITSHIVGFAVLIERKLSVPHVFEKFLLIMKPIDTGDRIHVLRNYMLELNLFACSMI